VPHIDIHGFSVITVLFNPAMAEDSVQHNSVFLATDRGMGGKSCKESDSNQEESSEHDFKIYAKLGILFQTSKRVRKEMKLSDKKESDRLHSWSLHLFNRY